MISIIKLDTQNMTQREIIFKLYTIKTQNLNTLMFIENIDNI